MIKWNGVVRWFNILKRWGVFITFTKIIVLKWGHGTIVLVLLSLKLYYVLTQLLIMEQKEFLFLLMHLKFKKSL